MRRRFRLLLPYFRCSVTHRIPFLVIHVIHVQDKQHRYTRAARLFPSHFWTPFRLVGQHHRQQAQRSNISQECVVIIVPSVHTQSLQTWHFPFNLTILRSYFCYPVRVVETPAGDLSWACTSQHCIRIPATNHVCGNLMPSEHGAHCCLSFAAARDLICVNPEFQHVTSQSYRFRLAQVAQPSLVLLGQTASAENTFKSTFFFPLYVQTCIR